MDSVNGSDSNQGTQAAPWKTIAKVNSTTLTPGQSVGFASGGVWRETLTVAHSGSAGNPITFGAYGTGAQPIITGADLVSGWTAYSGSIYQASVAWAPNQVYRNNVLLTGGASLGTLATDGEWFYSSGVLYVYSISSPASYTMEATRRNEPVLIISHGYINLDQLHLVKGQLFGLLFSAVNNISVSDCELDQSANDGVYISDGSSNLMFNGGSVHHNGIAHVGDSDGIGIGEAAAASHDITIENMKIYSNGTSMLGSNIAIGLTSTNLAPYNILIQGNTISTAGVDGIIISAGTNIAIQYNLILNNPSHGLELYNTVASPPTTSVSLYNNTIVGNGTTRSYGVTLANLAGTTTLTAKNNIIWGNVSGVYAEVQWVNQGAGGASFTSDYNNVFDTLGFGPFFYNGGFRALAAWQSGTNQDAHSKFVDPLFTDASTGDYTLQSNSPAIGAGVYIPGVTATNPPNIGAK